MKRQRDKWIARLLAVSCLGTALISPLWAGAAESVQVAEATTKDDLLLFWEEKDLIVESATRTDKPLSQTAENMIVITAEEIEKMNAHSVDEVLSRLPGVLVEFPQPNFVTNSNIRIQGSQPTHVSVLLDGVPFNLLSGATATTFMIPLQIVERIEVVKGAASSAWGSALGGVVNIITKNSGDTVIPRGTLFGTIGEASSLDYGGELYGKAGPVGYYLHAGRQETNGLTFIQYYRDAFFGKVTVAPHQDLSITLNSGYSNPANSFNTPWLGYAANLDSSAFYLNGEGEFRFSEELKLRINLHSIRQTITTNVNLTDPAQFLRGIDVAEKTIGGSIRLNYAAGMHNALLGMEGRNGDLKSTTNFGPLMQAATGLPASSTVYPDITSFSLYANDTVTLGPVSVIPGIRYDHNDISGSFVSPSLGLAWKLSEHTVARASVARGFTTPQLTALQGGGPLLIPNPDLKEEKVLSYQAGVESGVGDYLNLSATFFRHEMKDELTLQKVTPVSYIYINGGDVLRHGYELSAENVPLYNLSLKAAFSYVRISADSETEGRDNYLTQLRFRYDDRKSLVVDLYGQQKWLELTDNNNAKYNNFIWDLTATKRFTVTDTSSAEIFFSAHNLFSGSSFSDNRFENPKRWVEGGMRFKF
jgi:vitamin B12 transporter